MKKNNGFTMVEIIVVIVIIGILAAIAVPSINAVMENARKSRAEADAHQLANAYNMYNATKNVESTDSKNEFVRGNGARGNVSYPVVPAGLNTQALFTAKLKELGLLAGLNANVTVAQGNIQYDTDQSLWFIFDGAMNTTGY